MKPPYFNLPAKKRERILHACIVEFGGNGYEKASTARIIKRAAISKGGLYEYIDSKEELFIFIAGHCYTALYDYIHRHLHANQIPDDILERFRLVAQIAIDFYVENPSVIAFIVKSNYTTEPHLNDNVQSIFRNKFVDLFGTVDSSRLAFEQTLVLDLLRWLLLKTRDDFLLNYSQHHDIEKVKKSYMDEWEFYFAVLRNGIYRS